MQKLSFPIKLHHRTLCQQILKKNQSVTKASKKTGSKGGSQYTSTVFLPRTEFPRFRQVDRDNFVHEQLRALSSPRRQYEWQSENLSEPTFVLHDGPPYANGIPHIGHGINKILKDITLRYRNLMTQKIHYIPGYDCHGLPIELQVIQNNNVQDPLSVRNKAREIVYKYIKLQADAFRNWGVMASWSEDGCYFTHKTKYVVSELECFTDMYEKGLIHRDFKPVHWSPSSRTALAESELEYKEDHISTAAYVRFRLDTFPSVLNAFKDKDIYAIIWTTTPWTLVANQAIAFAPDLRYCIAERSQNELYIVAEALLSSVSNEIGNLTVKETFVGEELRGSRYIHPLNGESLPFLPGSHVTSTSGTGLVHSAPAHGKDDFLLAREANIPILSLVDGNGEYTPEAGPELQGLSVMTTGMEKVINLIGNDVLKLSPYQHRFPYDWRTHQPVITRASHQWFIDIEPLKKKAIEAIENIDIYPKCHQDAIRNGLIAQIKQRPYWCISRQRHWGTPIPVLYHTETNEPVVKRDIIKALCQTFTTKGIDTWWSAPLEDLIAPEIFAEHHLDSQKLTKGSDILDIWFDSGTSWAAVLPDNVADLYMEGFDQLTGWFQSSLLTSIALQGRAPYKTIFAHGFAVDEDGMKMSKSAGNGVSPSEIIEGGSWGNDKAYGIDTLRWWVASHACQHQKIPVKKTLFDETFEQLNKLRATISYLLGALFPYGSAFKCIKPEYHAIDKYILHHLYYFNQQIETYYSNYEFHHVTKAVNNFTIGMLSREYIPIVKYRLYCEEATSSSRVAVVSTMRQTLNVLLQTIMPIVPLLAEEAYLHHPERLKETPLYYAQYTPAEHRKRWINVKIVDSVEAALNVKSLVRKVSPAKTPLAKLNITVNAPENIFDKLSSLQNEEISSSSDLSEILQVASVKLIKCPEESETTVSVEQVTKPLCLRCKKYCKSESSDVCTQCAEFLENAKTKRLIL